MLPGEYHVVDMNAMVWIYYGEEPPGDLGAYMHDASVLDERQLVHPADVAFSVGIIEHFDIADTHRAVQSHPDSVKTGGIVVLSFPTPTLLYRIGRRISELLQLWTVRMNGRWSDPKWSRQSEIAAQRV